MSKIHLHYQQNNTQDMYHHRSEEQDLTNFQPSRIVSDGHHGSRSGAYLNSWNHLPILHTISTFEWHIKAFKLINTMRLKWKLQVHDLKQQVAPHSIAKNILVFIGNSMWILMHHIRFIELQASKLVHIWQLSFGLYKRL